MIKFDFVWDMTEDDYAAIKNNDFGAGYYGACFVGNLKFEIASNTEDTFYINAFYIDGCKREADDLETIWNDCYESAELESAMVFPHRRTMERFMRAIENEIKLAILQDNYWKALAQDDTVIDSWYQDMDREYTRSKTRERVEIVYSHDYPGDTVIGVDSDGNSVVFKAEFTSEDPDYGKEIVKYGMKNKTIEESLRFMKDAITKYLDGEDSAENFLFDGMVCSTTLIAIENALGRVA